MDSLRNQLDNLITSEFLTYEYCWQKSHAMKGGELNTIITTGFPVAYDQSIRVFRSDLSLILY